MPNKKKERIRLDEKWLDATNNIFNFFVTKQ